MLPIGDLWSRQFVEGMKELTLAYNRFSVTREIESFDAAYILHEELNEAYGMSLDLLDYVELGGALLAPEGPPDMKRNTFC